MRRTICWVIFPLMCSLGFSQIYTDFQAKDVLRNLGVTSSKMIQNAEKIIIEPGKISGVGGICIDLPILDFISSDQVILLNGVSGTVTNKGTIIIETNALYVFGIVYASKMGKKYFIAGPSLVDIVNYLLK